MDTPDEVGHHVCFFAWHQTRSIGLNSQWNLGWNMHVSSSVNVLLQ